MANIRVESVLDPKSGKYFVEVYYPEDSAIPVVVSKPIYNSIKLAEFDALRMFKEAMSKT